MHLTLDQASLQELAELVAPLIKQDSPQQGWAKLAEVQDDLFAGKAPAWIRLFIFDSFPQVQIENGKPEAWVMNAHGKGKTTQVYVPRARKWSDDHHEQINWTAKLP